MRTSDTAAVIDSITCLLPAPVQPSDVVVAGSLEALNGPGETRAAVFSGSRWRRRPRDDVRFEHLSHREIYWLLPRSGRPRAAFPADLPAGLHAALLKPSTDVLTLRQNVQLSLVRAVPGRALSALAPWIELATARPSALRLLVETHRPRERLGFIYNPTKYHRPVGHVICAAGSVTAIVKYAPFGRGASQLLRESTILEQLCCFAPLAGTVPVPVAETTDHLGRTIITDAFNGRPAPLELTPAIRAWLDRCRTRERVVAGKTELAAELRHEARETNGTNAGLLTSVVERALTSVGGAVVNATIVHGDFAPWNIVLQDGSPRVFDWEYACLDGVPGWDEALHSFQVGLVKMGWHSTDLVTHADICARGLAYPYTAAERRGIVALVMVRLATRNAQHGERDVCNRLQSALSSLLARDFLAPEHE